MRHSLAIVLVVCCVGADTPSVKTSKLDLPSEVDESIAKELDPEAIEIAGEHDGITLWLRTVIPAKATTDQIKNGLTYREIPEGTLLGVIRFAKTFTDFRKQEIPAGVYSLRFAVQPDTGDHMGTAPHPEFLLLTPIANDPSIEPIETKKLVERSSKITDGDHPAVMLLFPNFDKAEGPKLVENEGGVQVVQFRRVVDADGETTSLGFALVVRGHSKTR